MTLLKRAFSEEPFFQGGKPVAEGKEINPFLTMFVARSQPNTEFGMSHRTAILLFLLAGCSSPSLEFYGVVPKKGEFHGQSSDSYVLPDRIQVIRTSFDIEASTEKMRMIGESAIDAFTDCVADRHTVQADPSVFSARLTCEGDTEQAG